MHKSQGLTFRHVNIDFSGGVFAGGQTYVALSRCTSLDGISLREPIRQSDIFVRTEVVRFASLYNNDNIMQRALNESKADKEYREAVEAFDRRDFDTFISQFFLAIHSRYDIEKPGAKRFIRRKLNIINKQQREIERLKEEINRRDNFLKRLAVEYTLMGKECEKENMTDAAIANYTKALELYPEAPEARRRLNKLQQNTNK